jgi:hypothetical protein
LNLRRPAASIQRKGSQNALRGFRRDNHAATVIVFTEAEPTLPTSTVGPRRLPPIAASSCLITAARRAPKPNSLQPIRMRGLARCWTARRQALPSKQSTRSVQFLEKETDGLSGIPGEQEAPSPTVVYEEHGEQIQRWEIVDKDDKLIRVVEKQPNNDYLRLTPEGWIDGWFTTWRSAVGLVKTEIFRTKLVSPAAQRRRSSAATSSS